MDHAISVWGAALLLSHNRTMQWINDYTEISDFSKTTYNWNAVVVHAHNKLFTIYLPEPEVLPSDFLTSSDPIFNSSTCT